jgi:FMN phosphatase YigB (HAD superfamily)
MKTLFVDFDGTLCHDRFWQSLPPHEHDLIQQKLFTENLLMVIDWMLGKYTSEEVNLFVARETGIPYQKLWETFVFDCSHMTVSQIDLDLITALRTKYYIVLITGNMDSFNRFTAPTLYLHEYFDVIVNSYNEGKIKTDDNGALFLKYLQGDISEAVLIENSLDSYQTFKALGGSALLVSTQTGTTEHLKTLLMHTAL